MSPWQIATAIVLGLAAAASVLRLLRQPAIVPRWRRMLLLGLQPLCALLLYLALYPPARVVEAGSLIVLTGGASQPTATVAAGDAVIALPEAGDAAGAPLVPDLATALRQQPGVARLRVLGQGLPARDREAVDGRALAFERTALPPGLVGLSSPAAVAPGNAFSVRGQVSGLPGARVELLDPAGRRVDTRAVDARGAFTLTGQARMVGEVLFAVRVLDAGGTERDRQPLPLRVIDAAPLRVWIQAGAPQPEWKYLRRWAADAGLSLHTQIAAGAGLQLGDAGLPMDAATLAGFDLLWLDQRALMGLSRAQREAVLAAARRGLGVLVRLDGPADAGLRQALAQLGVPLRGGDGVTTLAPGTEPAPAADAANANATSDALPALTRRDFVPTAPLPVLAHDARGQPYAWWHAVGQGRIGVTTVTDSYRLTLAGAAALHGRQWSDALATLARPRPAAAAAFELPGLAWAGERVTLCGLGAQAQVRDPGGRTHALQRDAATGARACAAYWPQQAGWHLLVQGERREPFFVRDPTQARAWYLQAQAEATSQEVRSTTVATAAATAPGLPGSRWPAWSAFVLLAAASWWLERPRRA